MLKCGLTWIKEHPYSLALLYFIPYLIYFELLETFQVPKYILHCAIDDMIPFHESFIIPYFLWFPLLLFTFLYFLRTSKEEFLNLCFLMFTGMTICLILYTVLPNGLELRPHVLHKNILADLARYLYSLDTPTNVCPSIHVASTIAIMFVVLKSKSFHHPLLIKTGVVCLSFLICLSTLVLKQHSFIDVVCGFLLTCILYVITYYTPWCKVLTHTPLRKIVQ